jgi:DNA-binding transcriptional LysR family regulator
MSELLMPELAAFSERWPQIELCVEATYEMADLGSREADVAFRMYTEGKQPDEELAGRKAACLHAAIYGEEHQWIGWWDIADQKETMKRTPYADVPIHNAFNNIYVIKSACMEGMGLAYLPCFMADPALTRRTEPEHAADIWILVHPDLRRNPRLRLFRDEMVAAFKRLRPKIEG